MFLHDDFNRRREGASGHETESDEGALQHMNVAHEQWTVDEIMGTTE